MLPSCICSRAYTTQRMVTAFKTQAPINRTKLQSGQISSLMRYRYTPSTTFEMVEHTELPVTTTALNLRGVSTRRDMARLNAFRRAFAHCKNHVNIERPTMTNLVHRIHGSLSCKMFNDPLDVFSFVHVRPHALPLVPAFAALTLTEVNTQVHSVLLCTTGESHVVQKSVHQLAGYCAPLFKFVAHFDQPLTDTRLLMEHSRAHVTPTFQYVVTLLRLRSGDDMRKFVKSIAGHLEALEQAYGSRQTRDIPRHSWRVTIADTSLGVLHLLCRMLTPLHGVLKYNFVLPMEGTQVVMEYFFKP